MDGLMEWMLDDDAMGKDENGVSPFKTWLDSMAFGWNKIRN